jgi:hypothetical protein
MTARASTGRGMRVVYDKEGTDPCECQAVYCTAAHHRECVPVTLFRTGINDDEYGLHHDYEVWLEELAPHAPIDQYWHNDTGEDARPSRTGPPTRT